MRRPIIFRRRKTKFDIGERSESWPAHTHLPCHVREQSRMHTRCADAGKMPIPLLLLVRVAPDREYRAWRSPREEAAGAADCTFGRRYRSGTTQNVDDYVFIIHIGTNILLLKRRQRGCWCAGVGGGELLTRHVDRRGESSVHG